VDHSKGKVLEIALTLFDHSYVPFCFWYVLVSGTYVHGYTPVVN